MSPTRLFFLFALLVTLVVPCSASDLSDALEPLERPDLTAAKESIARLDALVKKTSGNKKVVAQRVRATVKNVFTAEHQIHEALRHQHRAEQLALEQEANAEEYLKPNPFGTVRHDSAAHSKRMAKKFRSDATARVRETRLALRSQLRELDTLTNDFYIQRAPEETIILHHVVEAIATRSLDGVPFQPTQTERSLASLRALAVHKAAWTDEAQKSELAGNYDKAFELYTKVGDRAGRQRAAQALAHELEAGGFFGSAIEYYEKAGDYKAAKKLRSQHPELLAASFKELNNTSLYAKVSPAVVKIRTDKAHGTGFVFRRNGYLLTSAHLLQDAYTIDVLLDNNRTLPATIEALDQKRDLAVLRVQTQDNLDHLRFARPDEVKVGTEIAALGFPTADLQTASMTTGAVTNNDREMNEIKVIELDLTIAKGTTGGPIVDHRGRILGLASTGKSLRSKLAISLEEIEHFLTKELGPEFITR